jgi:hypothetical protein
MRARLATCIVAIWTTGLPTAAKAETWCIRDRAGVTSEICAFSSANDCIRAAVVGPAGGIVCAQQTRRVVEDGWRGAFPNGDFRPNSGHAPKRHGKRSKKGKHV